MEPPPNTSSERRREQLWVSTTYFAEGFPYSIVNNVAEVLFKELGASLQVIGLTSLFHLPWNLKFLWGPLLDRYETKRRWLLGVEIGLTVLLVAVAAMAQFPALLGAIAACFMVTAFLAATHDIAIDGFYLEGLDEEGQSRWVGYRAMAYKLASLLVRGPMLILVGAVGWSVGFAAAAGVMALLLLAHTLLLPKVEQTKRPWRELLGARVLVIGAVLALAVAGERRFHPLGKASAAVTAALGIGRISVGGWVGIVLLLVLVIGWALRRKIEARLGGGDGYARAYTDFLAQPKVGHILAFVVFFRCGESFLQKMKWPFLRDHLHLTLEQYGVANGTLGVIASFVATLLGGWLISRHGLRRWIWPFVIAQNALNFLYVVLAGASSVSVSLITVAIAVEHFGEGLGTAVFMVYLMRCCSPDHKAAHMAIVTALMSLSFTIAGVASGFLADAIGFSSYFLLSCAATLPGMLLLFTIPHLDGREPAPDEAPSAA